MRCRSLVFIVAALLVGAASARADELVIRGNYWRDRNTRVLQPEVDISKEARTGTVIGAHYLLDAITSASVAAGAVRDAAFTELRHEVGFRLGQRIGPVLLTGAYSYSSESDYWAHFASLSAIVDLARKTTTLGFGLSYGHDIVTLRQGPTVYLPLGKLDSVGMSLSLNQVVNPQTTLTLGYELVVSGFGDASNGFQSNAYRPVNVAGSPVRELTPFQRFRHSLSGTVNGIIPTGGTLTPWIAFRPSLRVYWDDWGIASLTPELRTYLPVGPIEFRITGRYYWQEAASFFHATNDIPTYTMGSHCPSCTSTKVRAGSYYTADPKLSRFESFFFELRVLVRLRFLARAAKLPMSHWLAESFFEVSYGHYINTALAHKTFGDSEVGGLTFTFPL